MPLSSLSFFTPSCRSSEAIGDDGCHRTYYFGHHYLSNTFIASSSSSSSTFHHPASASSPYRYLEVDDTSTLPTPTPGTISTTYRQLSTEIIRSLNRNPDPNYRDYFPISSITTTQTQSPTGETSEVGHSSSSSSSSDDDDAAVALKSFLRGTTRNSKSGDDSFAPVELFQAINMLQHQVVDNYLDVHLDVSKLNVVVEDDDLSLNGNKEEDHTTNIVINQQQRNHASISNEGSSNVVNRTSEDDDIRDIDMMKRRINDELESVSREDRHSKLRYKVTLEAFNAQRSIDHGHEHEILDDAQLIGMFHFLIHNDTLLSYEVLKYYIARCKYNGGRLVRLDMYQRVIHRLRPMDMLIDRTKSERQSSGGKGPKWIHPKKLIELTLDIARHIQEEYSTGTKRVYQYILLPELVLALIENTNVDMKYLAVPIMEYILEHEFPVLNPDLYEYMLSRGRRTTTTRANEFVGGGSRAVVQQQRQYQHQEQQQQQQQQQQRQEDTSFPYHKVLRELVSSGHVPKAETVANVLKCYFPFHDTHATSEVLSVIQQLHLNSVKSSPSSPSPSSSSSEDYRIDMGTLEAVSMASARKNVDLALQVWDMVEQFGYSPTASMFEDVILSFAATRQDENMYSALADMERHGFEPSPLLLKYIALKVSRTDKNIAYSHKLLTWHGNVHLHSKHGMNALLAGYGMKRDINNAFLVFEEFAELHLQPDTNTFTFLMEALYIDTKERFPFKLDQRPQIQIISPRDVSDVVSAIQIILDAMDSARVHKTKAFYYEHIRVLYCLGLLEEGKVVLEEAVATGTHVPMQTLFMLATRFAHFGDFTNAQAVAGLSNAAGCGDFNRLKNRIKNIESSFNGDVLDH